MIDDAGRSVGKLRPKLSAGVHPVAFIFPLLYRHNFIGAPTVLVRRTAYEAVGSRYKEVWFNDHEMWLRLAARFDVGCLPGWDSDYRHHSGQTSSSRFMLAEKSLETLDLVDDLPISPSIRREARAMAHVRCALDAIERGERRRAVTHLAEAVRTDPLCMARPPSAKRILATATALAAGARGRRAVTSSRERRWHTGELLDMAEDA